jgi:hypothetical protein
MALTHLPVVVVASGGLPVVKVAEASTNQAAPMTVVDSGKPGVAITLVSAFGTPAKLYNASGAEYVPA